MPVRVKEGRAWDPYKADLEGARLKRKVKERWVELVCPGCGNEDTGWESTEPELVIPVASPFPPIEFWQCKSCGGWMEPKKRRQLPRHDLPNILGNWEPFALTNAGHEPIMIESREQYRRVLAERGCQNTHGVGGDRRGERNLWGHPEGTDGHGQEVRQRRR